ncbi:MAG: DotU family type IV/VI secretion system protein [Pikeienuella sp.]|uniref:DotU family type IV/VI secretion system protein n=1 Tax=Pikeienuella sp. TaxID=2831957 RepID=UPI00391BA622
MIPGADITRDGRDGLRAFQAVAAALDAVERTARAGGAPAAPREAAETAFAAIRRVLIDHGAPAAFDGRSGDGDPAYVLACYADEALLHHIDWNGRDVWPETLFERTLFGSRLAGDRIFAMAESAATGAKAVRDDLLAVLFLALSCGFRGKYRGADDRGAIRALAQKLYERMMERPPPQALSFREHLGAGYGEPFEAQRRAGSPHWRRWTWAPVAAALVWLALSHGLWWGRNHQVDTRSASILEIAEETAAQRAGYGAGDGR